MMPSRMPPQSIVRQGLLAGLAVFMSAMSLAVAPSQAASAAEIASLPYVRQAQPSSPASRQAQTAATPFQVSLADLGFTADPVMRGSRGSVQLGFPLPDRGIPGGRLFLNFDVSPVLHPSATLQVTVNGRPASAVTVGQLREARTLEVAVPPVEQAYLNVEIAGSLFSSTERCVPENDAALWVIVARNSGLVATANTDATSIASFLSLPGGTVAVRGRWDTLADREGSMALYSTVQHALRDRGTRVVLTEDIASLELAPTDRVRTVALAPDGDGSLRLENGTLVVGGQRAALDALVSESAQVLLSGHAVPVIEQVTSDPLPILRGIFGPVKSYRRGLTTLGLDTGERSGTGVLSTPIRFTVADLGGWPSDPVLDLSASFDQIPTSTLERAFLRIRLNGTLIESADLRGATTYKRLVHLPPQLLQPSNQLDLDFVYAAETGNCLGAPVSFNGKIGGDSGLVWSGYGPARGMLPEVITGLDQTDVIVADDSPETARTAARLVGGLGRLAHRPVTPHIVPVSSLTQRRAGATTVVVGGSGDVVRQLGLPVTAGASVDIVNTRTNEVVLRGTPDRSIVTAQYLAGSTPVLSVQASPGTDGRLVNDVVAQLVDRTRFFGWSGNVVLGVPGELVALDLTGNAIRAEQASVWDWRVLVSRYRWILTAVALLVLTFGCVSTYRRLGQRRVVPASTPIG